MSLNTFPKIIFMGTPSFAVASLDALIKNGFNIAAVVTAPDKPAGRGMKLHESEVKRFATDMGIRILQPANLKSADFLGELKEINPDLQVVVAFRMLPEAVWSLPPMGTINLHASLLPQYRGAAPINHAIINGEKETGITTFRLKHDIDTGNILLQKKVAISEKDNASTLHDKLMSEGAELLVQTILGLRDGTLKEISQDTLLKDASTRHAPKIFRDDCEIKWNDSIENIYNLVRGLSPRPGAFTFLNGTRIIIIDSEKDIQEPAALPGSYQTDGKTFLKYAANDGYISILKLKPEGKGIMKVEDFLRGRRNL